MPHPGRNRRLEKGFGLRYALTAAAVTTASHGANGRARHTGASRQDARSQQRSWCSLRTQVYAVSPVAATHWRPADPASMRPTDHRPASCIQSGKRSVEPVSCSTVCDRRHPTSLSIARTMHGGERSTGLRAGRTGCGRRMTDKPKQDHASHAAEQRDPRKACPQPRCLAADGLSRGIKKCEQGPTFGVGDLDHPSAPILLFWIGKHGSVHDPQRAIVRRRKISEFHAFLVRKHVVHC